MAFGCSDLASGTLATNAASAFCESAVSSAAAVLPLSCATAGALTNRTTAARRAANEARSFMGTSGMLSKLFSRRAPTASSSEGAARIARQSLYSACSLVCFDDASRV